MIRSKPLAQALRMEGRAMTTSMISSRMEVTATIISTGDESFQILPGRRTFTDVWSDPNIWISFYNGPDPIIYGNAVVGFLRTMPAHAVLFA